ncbi:hypothetical protein C8T65DRAFT_236448 [Cerioporus squamosus]|nr:hypothetical protein C8T65DRAFT_236448 [Cerioporus squamosus]
MLSTTAESLTRTTHADQMTKHGPVRVVNLPDPKPAVLRPRGGRIPAIPDDILRELATFLDFKDQLALSLTSRHIHAVVRPRLQDVVVEARQLAALHRWIFEDPSVRGPHLRSLAFIAPPVYWSWFDNARYAAAVRHCFDIIGQASKLEKLSCTSSLSHALGSQHLQAFTNLRFLHLCECTGKMLASLQLPATLTKLHLSDTPAGTVIPFRRILRSIYRLPALRTLVLERLSLPDNDNADEDEDADEEVVDGIEVDIADENHGAYAAVCADEDADGLVENEHEDEHTGAGGNHNNPGSTDTLIIPSVRTLKTLEQELPPCVSLETTFPGLQTFVLDGSTHLNRDVRASGTQTLQHLVVSGSFEGEPVGWSVNHLTYVPGAPPCDDGLILDSACDPTQLVSLTLQLVFISFLVWDKVIRYAPNIRLLEIESFETALPEYLSLLSEHFKPDAPIGLPLLCLSILAPAASTQAPEDREKKWHAFLARALKHLPSLRYVALAESPARGTCTCGCGARWACQPTESAIATCCE